MAAGAPRNNLEISSSLLFGCSPFSVQLGRLVSRAGVRFLRVSVGRGCQVLLVGLSKPPQTGYITAIEFPAPTHPLRLISALSAMTYLIVNPFHLHSLGDLSKHCLPPPLYQSAGS